MSPLTRSGKTRAIRWVIVVFAVLVLAASVGLSLLGRAFNSVIADNLLELDRYAHEQFVATNKIVVWNGREMLSWYVNMWYRHRMGTGFLSLAWQSSIGLNLLLLGLLIWEWRRSRKRGEPPAT